MTEAKARQRGNPEDGMAGYTRTAFAFCGGITRMLPNIARTGSSAGPRAESRKRPPTLVEGATKSAFGQQGPPEIGMEGMGSAEEHVILRIVSFQPG